jgi:LAO/AO transport system kinase
MADLVVINKADIDPDAATRARATITSSLRLLGQHGRPEHAAHDAAHWHPTVLQLSALKAQGIDAFWSEIQRFRALQTDNGELAARRQRQAKAWMWERIDAGLKQRFREHPAVRAALDPTTRQVLDGQLPASTAARQLLALFD